MFPVFQRGQRAAEGQREQRNIVGTEGCRGDRGPQRGQGVIEGKRDVDETEGSRVDRGL